MVLLVLGMILCGLCMGCGEEIEPNTGTQPVSEVWREVTMPPEKMELRESTTRSEEEQVQGAIVLSVMKENVAGPVEGEMRESTASPLPPVAAEPQVHTHTIVTETLAATCLEAGVIRESCEVCKKVLSEAAEPPLGHDFIKSVWELPTCQKGGYYNNICSRCGLVECVTQKPLPHGAEDILLQEGNCMEDTVIQHVCKMCGTQIKSDTRYTPYDTHLWVTAMIEGAEITYCERCGVAK